MTERTSYKGFMNKKQLWNAQKNEAVSMRVVLRIGGSVVASPIKPALIGKYVELLKKLWNEGNEIVVVVGGGALARELIQAAKDLRLGEKAQDEIAISASRIFAQLFTAKMESVGCGAVPLTVESAAECLQRGKLAVMGGLRPGMTTDTVAALVAEKIGASLLVKATDQDGVFNKDPRKYGDAVKLDHLSFGDLAAILAEGKHRAGIHQIIDPEAVKLLKRHTIKVAVVNGFEPGKVVMAIKGKCVGTLIE